MIDNRFKYIDYININTLDNLLKLNNYNISIKLNNKIYNKLGDIITNEINKYNNTSIFDELFEEVEEDYTDFKFNNKTYIYLSILIDDFDFYKDKYKLKDCEYINKLKNILNKYNSYNLIFNFMNKEIYDYIYNICKFYEDTFIILIPLNYYYNTNKKFNIFNHKKYDYVYKIMYLSEIILDETFYDIHLNYIIYNNIIISLDELFDKNIITNFMGVSCNLLNFFTINKDFNIFNIKITYKNNYINIISKNNKIDIKILYENKNINYSLDKHKFINYEIKYYEDFKTITNNNIRLGDIIYRLIKK